MKSNDMRDLREREKLLILDFLEVCLKAFQATLEAHTPFPSGAFLTTFVLVKKISEMSLEELAIDEDQCEIFSQLIALDLICNMIKLSSNTGPQKQRSSITIEEIENEPPPQQQSVIPITPRRFERSLFLNLPGDTYLLSDHSRSDWRLATKPTKTSIEILLKNLLDSSSFVSPEIFWATFVVLINEYQKISSPHGSGVRLSEGPNTWSRSNVVIEEITNDQEAHLWVPEPD